MYKLIITCLCFLASTAVFALFCPNNGAMLNFKDSIQEVTARCGQSISSQNYTKETIISAEWTYYINSLNNTNTKLIILFNQAHIANITLIRSGENEQNVRSSNICRMPIQIGNDMNYVQSACGNPMNQKTLQTMSTQITELKYDGMAPNTLIFESGSLASWK